METSLENTTSSEIARAMVKARIAAGSPAMDMVLTALVITDDETVGEALQDGGHPVARASVPRPRHRAR